MLVKVVEDGKKSRIHSQLRLINKQEVWLLIVINLYKLITYSIDKDIIYMYICRII